MFWSFVALAIVAIVLGNNYSAAQKRRRDADTRERLPSAVRSLTGAATDGELPRYNRTLKKAPSDKPIASVPAIVAGSNVYNDAIVGICKEGMPVRLRREPRNEFDVNAIAVHVSGAKIGYLKAPLARRLAPRIDRGDRIEAFVASMYVGPTGYVRVTVMVSQHG